MDKLKKIFLFFKKNVVFNYFVFLILIYVSIIGVFRPLVQKELQAQAISAPTESKKSLPIYSVNTEEKKVAISFDAAWGADDTEELLKILADNDVKATFFLCGYWIDEYEDEVKRIYEEGHEIANHSNTHPHGSQLSLEENKNEILEVHNKIKNLLNYEMNLYRAPFGEYNDTVLAAAEELGYYTIQWDIDSLDWKEYGVSEEISQVLDNENLKNGSIILFHNDAKYTPDALDDILKGLKAKGYEIVTVGELIYKENYFMDHTGRQYLREESN